MARDGQQRTGCGHLTARLAGEPHRAFLRRTSIENSKMMIFFLNWLCTLGEWPIISTATIAICANLGGFQMPKRSDRAESLPELQDCERWATTTLQVL